MEHHESFFADPRSWVAIAFVLFFVLLGPKMWKVMVSALDKRAETIRRELAEAERLRAEAEAMLKDANKRREQAMSEATALLEGAKREAARLAAIAASDAEQAARRREKMAMDRIAAAEKAAVDEVRLAAADIAAAAAKTIIVENLSSDAGNAIVDRAIAQLPQSLSPRRVA
jgi:F-type H+-transporting ATPase subunit b